MTSKEMLESNAKIYFAEPYDLMPNADCIITIRAKDAVEYMRNKNLDGYKDDLDALEDFLCIYWASNNSDECEESVINKIKIRRNNGRIKYGCTMERTDLTKKQWLMHAQEEALDLAIYLERCIREEPDG